MNLLNRLLVVLLAVAWTGVLVAALVLVWDTSHYLNVDSDAVQFSLRLTLTQSERVLASLAIVALILPALALAFFETTGGVRSGRAAARRRQAEQQARDAERMATERYDTIEARLNRIESMVSSRPPQHADLTPPERLSQIESAIDDAETPIGAITPAAPQTPNDSDQVIDAPSEPPRGPRRRWFGGGTSVSPS